MPVHFPALSRRRFLGLGAATAAALVSNPSWLAVGQNDEQSAWALLSDPHLAADRSLMSRGINMTRHFEQVSRELLALSSAPKGVLITGDCAYNTGEIGDYSLLVDLLAPLWQQGLPIHLVLGNH